MVVRTKDLYVLLLNKINFNKFYATVKHMEYKFQAVILDSLKFIIIHIVRIKRILIFSEVAGYSGACFNPSQHLGDKGEKVSLHSRPT